MQEALERTRTVYNVVPLLFEPLEAAALPRIWEVGVNLSHIQIRHDIPEPQD